MDLASQLDGMNAWDEEGTTGTAASHCELSQLRRQGEVNKE